jgi:hypothetical protein
VFQTLFSGVALVWIKDEELLEEVDGWKYSPSGTEFFSKLSHNPILGWIEFDGAYLRRQRPETLP